MEERRPCSTLGLRAGETEVYTVSPSATVVLRARPRFKYRALTFRSQSARGWRRTPQPLAANGRPYWSRPSRTGSSASGTEGKVGTSGAVSQAKSASR
ncbi:hypothetical protein HispidOSU_028725 [Sigmodon hispidus]